MEAIAEAQGECYNSAPSFGNFGFDDDVNLDLAEYKIDGGSWTTIFSGIDASEWNDDGWTLPGFGPLGEGSHTVYFRVKDDAGNVNGEGTPDTYSWQFIKDTTDPDPPEDLTALPGHNKVRLTWTNPTGDASFVGVEIRRVGWGDYPQYGTPGPGAPSYPADNTQGTFVAQTAAEAYVDSLTPRDIYYYALFSYDCAGNYSALGTTAKDRSTSYWLGDVNPATVGDGNVNIVDLAVFSVTFGEIQGGGAWNAEGDFGPTHDYSRLGIPEPDDAVDFEDLMVFAMNYGNVSPVATSGLVIADASSEKPLRDQVGFRLVPVSRDGQEVTYSIVIENEAQVLKGFALTLDYGLGNELVELKAASHLSGKGSQHFFGTIERELGKVEICVAALGINKAFEHTGEVARVVVTEGSNVPSAARLGKVDLRDLNNKKDVIEGSQNPTETPYIPKASALLQNHPNPFNPVTMITYDVAKAGNVRIDIYDVSGRLVRTLVNNHRDPGRYHAEWNGRNANGGQVRTGVYFYLMKAPGYTSPAKKMLLLK
jgi:hypothetical protein